MNKALSIVLAAAIAAGAVPFARSIEAPSPPPGISTNNWIPMGDAAGFVITTLGNDFHKGLRSEPNIVKGHFMARREGAWFRVDSSPDYETHPAECPNTRSNPLYGI
jgi:hypothetical protein